MSEVERRQVGWIYSWHCAGPCTRTSDCASLVKIVIIIVVVVVVVVGVVGVVGVVEGSQRWLQCADIS